MTIFSLRRPTRWPAQWDWRGFQFNKWVYRHLANILYGRGFCPDNIHIAVPQKKKWNIQNLVIRSQYDCMMRPWPLKVDLSRFCQLFVAEIKIICSKNQNIFSRPCLCVTKWWKVKISFAAFWSITIMQHPLSMECRWIMNWYWFENFTNFFPHLNIEPFFSLPHFSLFNSRPDKINMCRRACVHRSKREFCGRACWAQGSRSLHTTETT